MEIYVFQRRTLLVSKAAIFELVCYACFSSLYMHSEQNETNQMNKQPEMKKRTTAQHTEQREHTRAPPHHSTAQHTLYSKHELESVTVQLPLLHNEDTHAHWASAQITMAHIFTDFSVAEDRQTFGVML